MRCSDILRVWYNYKKSTYLKQLKRLWLFQKGTTKKPSLGERGNRELGQWRLVVAKKYFGCSKKVPENIFGRPKTSQEKPVPGASRYPRSPARAAYARWMYIPVKAATCSGSNRTPIGAKRRWQLIILLCGRNESRASGVSA